VRTLRTVVAGVNFKEQSKAITEFWRRMEVCNGGRPGDPGDYASITDVRWDDGRGWIIEYEVPAELLDRSEICAAASDPEPDCQNLIEPAQLTGTLSVRSGACEALVPVKDVLITGWNPRKAFDGESLQALAEDIRQNGLINAVTVRPKGKSKYELVAGERRLRAFRLLGRVTIPAKVRELTDEQVLDIMLAENLQRVDLNPIEEAHHLKRVLEVGKLTQTELGRRVGKSQEWVSQRLRLAEAPGVLQDLIIRRRINTSSAIEVLGWKNTEHYDAIMHDIGAWSVEGEELPRARVREIIKEITEPVAKRPPHEQGPSLGTIISTTVGDQTAKDPTCKDCGNSTWSDGKLICAQHGHVNPDGRYCEKFVAPSLGDDDAPVSEGEIAEPADLPFVNPEDCKDCDIYDREKNECPEGCTCAEECEDCFCERAEEEGEKQDLPDEPEPVADLENEPDSENEKEGDGLMITERPEDFRGNKGVPMILGKHDSNGYHGRLIGASNGELLIETGDPKHHHLEDLRSEVAAALGCAKGDVVPIAVDITRGAITIRRRGKF